MKQLAGGINAQFRANNSTAPQENSQPGAVDQSYRTGRIFGQISVNVDGDISPACVCLGANGGSTPIVTDTISLTKTGGEAGGASPNVLYTITNNTPNPQEFYFTTGGGQTGQTYTIAANGGTQIATSPAGVNGYTYAPPAPP
jgi:hypothetical protein